MKLATRVRIQLKVSIAVAFALIRRKPLHKSAKEYAKEEQEKYLKYWQNCKATQQIQDVCASQEDSGFESGKMTNEKIDNHIVSSSIFRPVTHSSDTNFLLTKSLESVLKYVRKQITENAEETFSKWQGSILEHLFSILKKVLNIGFCTDLIVSLIQDILNRLWETSDGNKNVEWEYQCLILADLCNNELICGEILNFLSEKLNELVVHLQYRVTNCVHTLDIFPLALEDICEPNIR
ncbi:hypothetical protein AAG570_006812 [Ranatra chinensis]|uniref:Uncharacterized protein n=1 Tax=Ranatra chinensis TaxID=642074 RepID=A0ABD0YV54_9HEMI